MSNITIDHIIPISRTLEKNEYTYLDAKVALNELDAYIRSHEKNEYCKLDKEDSYYLNNQVEFKNYCAKLRDHGISDAAKDCEDCNGRNLGDLCKNVYEGFKKDVEKGSESVFFGIQLIDHSENCKRGNYSDIENKLLRQIIANI